MPASFRPSKEQFHRSAAAFMLGGFSLSLFLAIPLPAFAAQISADSLKGYWKFDETSAGTFADSSGDGNTGTGNGASGTNNTPQPSTDVPSGMAFTDGRSLSFDGTDDFVDVNSTFGITAYPFSMCAWVKANTTADGSFLSFNVVGTSDQYFSLEQRDSKFSLVARNTAFSNSAGSTTVSTGVWYSICGVFVSNTDKQLWVNGVNEANFTSSVAFPSPTHLYISRLRSPDSIAFWPGLIDDVRVYDRALAPWEIAELAAGRHIPAYWNGTASTGLENKSNWSGSYVPDPYSLMNIRWRGSQPFTLTGAISAAGLTIGSGAAVKLNAQNFTMTDAGTFTNYGTLQLEGAETLTSVSNPTDKGTVLVYGTTALSSLPTGLNYYNLNLNDGLVGYWKLDEPSGTRAADASGYANSGSLVGGASISTTVAPTNFYNARSVSFNGTDGYVQTSISPSYPTAAPLTISAWIYPEVSAVQGIAGIFDPVSSFDWFALDQNGTTVRAIARDDAGAISGASQNIVLNQWQHVVAVFDSATNRRMYVNGVGGTVNTTSQVPAMTSVLAGIGRWSDGSPSNYYQGKIDDVRIYNRALSPAEVAALAAGNQPSTGLATLTLDGALDVNGDLLMNGGTLDVSSSNYGVTIGGNFLNSGGTFVARKGTVTFDGAIAGLEILTGGQRFHNLTLNGAGATWNTRDRLTASGTLSLTAGTLDASGSYVLRAGTVTQTSGTFVPRAGTLVLTSGADQTATLTSTANVLRIEDSTEDGLVGYWKFDEGTNSGSIIDSAGGNTGVRRGGSGRIWSGGSLYVPSAIQFDNPFAMEFDGTDDYVIAGSALPTQDFTYATWINPRTINDEMIMMAPNSAGGNEFYLYLASTLQVVINNGGNQPGNTTISAGVWTHVAVTRNGSANTLYVNGVPDGTFTDGTTLDFGGCALLIGTDADSGCSGTLGNYFSGRIDDARVYNRALSANEIANLARGRYAAGGSGTSTFTLGANIAAASLFLDSGNLSTSSRALTVTDAVQLLRGGGNLTLGSATTTFNGGFTLSGSLVTGSSGTFDINGAVQILTGSLLAPSGSMTVSGDWNKTGGTFTHNSGTVQFDGTNQTLSGSLAFHNLTKTVSAADTFKLAWNGTLTVSGALTLRGQDSNLLTIRSTKSGTAPVLVLDGDSGTQTLDYLNVADSDATGGQTLICYTNTEGCVDGGGTTNWTIAAFDGDAPSVTTVSPADDAVDVSLTANLVLTFDETTRAGTGTLTIKKTSDDSTIETITVSGAQLSGNDSTSLTLDPSTDLEAGTAYYVVYGANAFKDAAGNHAVAQTSSTAWNFEAVADAVVVPPSEQAGTGGSGGGGGGTRGSSQSMAARIAQAQALLLSRFDGKQRSAEKESDAVASEDERQRIRNDQKKREAQIAAQQEALEIAAKNRENRIAERITEHRAEIARLSEEQAAADRELAAEIEQRLEAERAALALQEQELERERAENKQRREELVAERKAAKEQVAVAHPAGTSEPLTPEVIGARRGILVAYVNDSPILFADVRTDAWYAPYVSSVIEEGIASGYADEQGKPKGEFGVANAVTRAEVLKMALEAADTTLAGGTPRNATAKNTWASAYVAQAESLLLSVFSPSSDVNAPATRGEVIQTILEVLKFPIAPQAPTFADVPATHPYAKGIATAAFFGLIEGDRDASGALNNRFRPDEPINRAETAKIIALLKEVGM